VLDALAAINFQIFLDLARVASVLVDWNANLAVGARQRSREQARRAALDVEETDFAEVEKLFIKARPDIHAAAMDIVGEMIQIEEARASRTRIARSQPFEFDVIARTLGTVPVNQVEQAAADPLDGGHVERLLRRRNAGRLGAERDCALIGRPRINHAERHRRRARPMLRHEVETVGARLFVDEIVDVVLAIDGDLLCPVTRDRRKAHQLEKRVQLLRFGIRVSDELEPVRPHRIIGADGGRRRIVRKRTDWSSPKLLERKYPSSDVQWACK
jgi:hypothetical protein